MKPEYLMERFIRKTNKHWDKIKAKDLDYFKNIGVHFLNLADSSGIDNVIPDEDKGVLGGLQMNHVNSFAEFLNGKYTDEQGNEVTKLTQFGSIEKFLDCISMEDCKPGPTPHTV